MMVLEILRRHMKLDLLQISKGIFRQFKIDSSMKVELQEEELISLLFPASR